MKKALICVLAVFLFCLCAGAQGAETEHELLPIFRKSCPDKRVLVVKAGDCNDDGIEDLVVVYSENPEENRMVAVYSRDGGFLVSPAVKAPLENCTLQWRNIDERPPVELLVSGQKGIYFGFAVFRFVNGEWVSLFGNNMEGCC